MEPLEGKLVRIHHIQEQGKSYAGLWVKSRQLTGEGVFACWPTGGCVRDVQLQRLLFDDMPIFEGVTKKLSAEFERLIKIVPELTGGVLPKQLYLAHYSQENQLFVFPYANDYKYDDLMQVLKMIFGEQNECPVANRLILFDCELVLTTERIGRMQKLFRTPEQRRKESSSQPSAKIVNKR
jgi:hypothetical protein